MTTQATPEIKSVADALDAGIALAATNGAPPLPPADDADGGTSHEDSTPDTAADGAGSPGGDAPDDQSGDAGDGTGTDGDSADSADGTAGADGAGGKDGAGGDSDAADDPAKAGTKEGEPGARKPDHFNDPIPNALKPATKERIRFLATEAKEQRTRAETASSERDELIKAITDTGASPEQYSGVLDYLELVNSKDQNKLKQAANFMIRELSALSRVGGFRIAGITSYAGHKDLEEAVTKGSLTPELAEEIAASRAAQTHQGKVGAAQQQASVARQRYQEADQTARQAMNTMEAEFRKNDPLYKEKQPMIIGMLNAMIAGDKKAGIPPLHPSKWPTAYKSIYENLPKTLGGMRPAARSGAAPDSRVPANTPLRTQQPAGAQKQAPKSVAEALDMGIEMARGG
jgi:hypothetical protein